MPRKEDPENIARRKDQIIKAAIAAFSRAGFKRTSMNDIVNESGLSKGAIYWYFKSKDEIINALTDSFFNSGMPDLKRIAESEGSAATQMRDVLDIVIAEMQKMLKIRPVIQEIYVLALRNKSIKKLARKEFDTYHALLMSIIVRGISQGEFKKVDPSHVANAIISLMEGTLLIWSVGIEGIDINEQLRKGTELLISAITI